MSQPCPRCLSAECSRELAIQAGENVSAFDISACAQRTAARAEKAESRAVEMMAQIGALVAEQAEFERDGLHVAAAANLEKLRALKRSQHYGNCWFRGGSREVHSMGGPVRLECDCCSTGDYNAAIDVEIRVLDAPDAAKGGE